jgi:hypothetical protein
MRISILLQAPAGSEQKWTAGIAPVATWLRVRGTGSLLRAGMGFVGDVLVVNG